MISPTWDQSYGRRWMTGSHHNVSIFRACTCRCRASADGGAGITVSDLFIRLELRYIREQIDGNENEKGIDWSRLERRIYLKSLSSASQRQVLCQLVLRSLESISAASNLPTTKAASHSNRPQICTFRDGWPRVVAIFSFNQGLGRVMDRTEEFCCSFHSR